MDALFRSILGNFPVEEKHREAVDELTDEDRKSVDWAVRQIRLRVKEAEFVTEESKLRAKVPGIEAVGTMDGLAPNMQLTADLKTGQLRSYHEQMAAYALAMMETYFTDEWRTILVFCDQREVVDQSFTRDQSERIVREVVAAYHDPNKQATPCEYCGWCAKAKTCDARLVIAEDAMSAINLREGLDPVLDDHEKLTRFLAGAKVVDELNGVAKNHAKEKLVAGHEIPGLKAISVKGREFVRSEKLRDAVANKPGALASLMEIMGAPTPNKLRDWWEESVEGDPPDDLFDRPLGHVQLRQSKPKKEKAS